MEHKSVTVIQTGTCVQESLNQLGPAARERQLRPLFSTVRLKGERPLVCTCSGQELGPMSTQVIAPTSYQVETSGWDIDENFLIEKTDLEWTDDEKTIRLQHPVRKGAVVFVRLMGIDAQEDSFPVAYQAAAVTYRVQERCYNVSLMQMVPRMHAGMPDDTSLE